ncbi:MAG: pyridoxamine 5'-phosphate oxidase family protein [Chloroflexi bacterium]|nr:pyridoxamine 5'-phosphate oxidase family protein [Chloroflexota bacterium]
MIQLTGEMKTAINNALADRAPCLLATASPDGRPSIGYRGSMMVFDESSLAYWERTFGRGSENVEANPHVAVLYRNPETRKAWKFFGRAEVHRDGPVRERVMARVVQPELDRDPDRKGVAVIVRLERVETMAGQVLLAADPGP